MFMHLYLYLSIHLPLHFLPFLPPPPMHLSPSVLTPSSVPWCITLSVRLWEADFLRHRQVCARSASLITNSVRSKAIHSGPIYNNATLLPVSGGMSGQQADPERDRCLSFLRSFNFSPIPPTTASRQISLLAPQIREEQQLHATGAPICHHLVFLQCFTVWMAQCNLNGYSLWLQVLLSMPVADGAIFLVV